MRIRQLLEAKGLTQEQFSTSCGIPMRTLARRLHKSNPNGTTLEEIAAMADALGVPLAALLSVRRIAEVKDDHDEAVSV